jgi:hypothetical protein|tara:strand:- start:2501 stop:2971 length:471 start_codon:yes stop_codon:yes gene_type:complete
MLAELAACNAAFNVIKSAVKNGSELTRCAKQIGAFVNGEDQLRKNLHKKKNSIWHKVGGSDGDDLEEFFALEEIAEKRKELEQLMIYVGRPGLHGDWVRFQVESRKRRIEEEKDRVRKIAKLQENILIGTLWVLGILAASGLLFGTLFILRQKGII